MKWLPRAGRGWGISLMAEKYGVSLGNNENVLKLFEVMLDNSANVLKATELYTLNGWTVWFMNSI